MKIYVVYLYCDYRKEVDLQFLKAFHSDIDAINFAKKYSNDSQSLSTRYVSIKGSLYDAELFYPGDDVANPEVNSVANSMVDHEANSMDDPMDDPMDYPVDDHVKTLEIYSQRKEKEARIKKELKIKSNMWYTRIGVDELDLEP